MSYYDVDPNEPCGRCGHLAFEHGDEEFGDPGCIVCPCWAFQDEETA